MSGMELFQRLAAECPDALKKFIFTTGDVLSGNVKEFLEKTGRPYLSKPFPPENLRDVVRKTLIAD
jgi:CheY-like chemotaxis protein